MLSPETPEINESLIELDYEMEEYIGESALTLFESLAEPIDRDTEATMGGTNCKDTPQEHGPDHIDCEDWD